jgi:hypothetical protein
MGDRKLTAEELELVGVMMQEKEQERSKSKFHNWGASGKTTYSYVRPVRSKKSSLPLFAKAWVHRFIKSKNVSRSLFPHATVWDVVCSGPGENVCPACKGVMLVQDYADYLESKGKKTRADELRQICKSTKAKELRHWVGINYDPETTEITGIEPYQMSEYFFKDTFLKLLLEKKYTLAQWIKKHPSLKKMKLIEREAHYLENCPPARQMPDHPKEGWKVCIEKSGKGINTSYKCSYEEDVPLAPKSDEMKELKEAAQAGTIPSLDVMLEPMDKETMTKALGSINKLLVGKHMETEPEDEDGPVDGFEEGSDDTESEFGEASEADDSDVVVDSDDTSEDGEPEEAPATDDAWDVDF